MAGQRFDTVFYYRVIPDPPGGFQALKGEETVIRSESFSPPSCAEGKRCLLAIVFFREARVEHGTQQSSLRHQPCNRNSNAVHCYRVWGMRVDDV